MSARTIREFSKRNPQSKPAGVHVDALHEIRRAMRALRRAERRIMAAIRAEKRAIERELERARSNARAIEHMREVQS